MPERPTPTDLSRFSNPPEMPVEFRENEFAGKVILITGASRGIGAAVARRFAQLGASGIVINSRVDSQNAATSLINELQDIGKAAGTRALWIPGDIAAEDTAKLLVAGTVQEFGRLDVLVSNAGMRSKKEKLTFRTPEEEIREIMEANFFGGVRIIKAAATQMIRQRPQGGEIIVTSSLAAEGNPGQPGYAASKGAMNSYVKTLAAECQVFDIPIRINAVAPGLVETDLTKDLSSQQRTALLTVTHSERALKPEEVAESIVFLASDHAADRNGQIIPLVADKLTPVLPEGAIYLPSLTIGSKDNQAIGESLDSTPRLDIGGSTRVMVERMPALESSTTLDLMALDSHAMGFSDNLTTEQIFEKATELGDELPAEAGAYLAIEIAKGNIPLEIGKRLVIIMKPVLDPYPLLKSDGIPAVFEIIRDIHGVRLTTHYALPDSQWDPTDQFIVSVRK